MRFNSKYGGFIRDDGFAQMLLDKLRVRARNGSLEQSTDEGVTWTGIGGSGGISQGQLDSAIATVNASISQASSDTSTALAGKAGLVSGRVPYSQLPADLAGAIKGTAPSGDATGATDLTAINSALTTASAAGGGTVVLLGKYFINGPIQMPDNTGLLGLGNTDVTLVGGSNSNVIKNKDQTSTGNKNIAIIGAGRFRLIGQFGAKLTASSSIGNNTLSLDTVLPNGTYQIEGGGSGAETVVVTNGNSTSASSAPYTATLSANMTKAHSSGKGIANQIRQSSLRDNVGMFMVMVDGLRVHNVEIGPTNAFTGCLQGVKNAKITNVQYNQDVITVNQDGIDVGPGCSNITIDGVTGKTGDDFCSIYAQNTSGSLHPLFAGNVTANFNDISNVVVRNVNVDVGINVFRLQAGDGFKLSGVFAENIVNTHSGATTTGSPQCVVQTGPTSYVNTAPTAAADIDHVVVDGYVGKFDYVLSCDSVIAHAQFSNIHHNSTAWTRIMGTQSIVTAWVPLASHVTFENITTSNTAGGGVVMALAKGTIDNATFRNIQLERATGILVNDATVTNINLSDIHARVMGAIPFRSTVAETGYADNVTIDIYSSGVNDRFTVTACKLRLGTNMPFFGSGDVTPVATAGSFIICKAGKDPTGGSFASGATYFGDGTNWNRGVTLTAL